jgi:(4S)-4-hydroxy-5-phosphonooxypentane-2,3-dione isomerase
MLTTCVYIHVKAEKIDSFILETIENHCQSVKEPGNLRFDFIQQVDDPTRFMLYEAYESEEAAAAHKNTHHYLKWRQNVNDLLAEPRTGVKYKIIEPNDRTKW